MKKNGSGKYEVSAKEIVAWISIAAVLFGIGGAWVGQKNAIADIGKDVQENTARVSTNCDKIENLQDRYHQMDKTVASLKVALENLNTLLTKLEAKLDAH